MNIQPIPAAASKPVRDRAKRVLPARPRQAARVIFGFTAVLYLIELINSNVFGGELDRYGIVSHQLSGLPGVVWAPLLHVSWSHLYSNTIPVLLFGFLAMSVGVGRWIVLTATIWLVSGLGVWFFGSPHTLTIGASGLAFGWLAFLLVRGIFNRGVGQILIALVLLFFWGGVLLGLLPGTPGISWQAHLFGALGGILAAWLTAHGQRSGRFSQPTGWTRPSR